MCTALVLGAPEQAFAHSPVPGIEGFYVGFIDPLAAAPQLLLLLGLGLLIGSFGSRRATSPLVSFLVATLVGILLGAGLRQLDIALLAAASICGAAAAIAPGRYLGVPVVLASLGGVLIGAISLPDPGPLSDRIITVAGSFVGANIALLYVSGGSYLVREKYPFGWVVLAFRVASFLLCAVAIVLLVLAVGSVE